MGEKRSAVTESDEIDYEPPVAERVLERGKPDKGPDTKDHQTVGGPCWKRSATSGSRPRSSAPWSDPT